MRTAWIEPGVVSLQSVYSSVPVNNSPKATRSAHKLLLIKQAYGWLLQRQIYR